MNLKEFCEWAKGKSLANPEPNGKYKGECVSFIQQYLYKVFNKSFKAYGNAKDWSTNYPKNYFKKVTGNYQAGDVLVYGSNHGNGYGHMGLINYDKKYIDQNGIKKDTVATANKPIFDDEIAILRPINQSKLGLESSSEKFEVGKTYKTQVELYIRKKAGTDEDIKKVKDITENAKENAKFTGSNQNAVLKKGTKVTCQATEKIGKDIWIKIPSGWVAGYYKGEYYVK